MPNTRWIKDWAISRPFCQLSHPVLPTTKFSHRAPLVNAEVNL